MRDALHITGLFLLFAFLALQYPQVDAGAFRSDEDVASFASFVTLSPAAHAAFIEAARTSWQVSNEARGTLSVGRLDSDVPLLSDALPPLSGPNLSMPSADGAPIPPPDPDAYSLIPPTMGRDEPAFAARAPLTETDHPPDESSAKAAFAREDMLSTENSKTLKEIMQ